MKFWIVFSRITVLPSLFLLIADLQPARADSLSPLGSIQVTTVLDEYNTGSGCSLREAIESANTDTAFGGCTTGSGTDTITFKTGIDHIQLSIDGGVGGETSNSYGDLNVITDMTIQGNGRGVTIIDASYQTVNPSRIFNIHTLAANLTVSIKDLSLWFGDSGDYGGGAIFNRESLLLEDVDIKNSHSGEFGGAIHSVPFVAAIQSTTLRRCYIGNNSALLSGGGIYSQFGLSIEGSTFDNNFTSSATSTNGGGGVYNWHGLVTITGSTFKHNTSASQGGNLFLISSANTATIEDNIFTEGLADRDGGNINAWAEDGDTGTLYLRRNEVSTGTAAHGGGISNNLSLHLENDTISGNNSNLGGGLYAASDQSSITLNASTVVYNSDDDVGYGDGIYNKNGPFQFVNSIIAFNGYSGIAVGRGWDCGGSIPWPPPSLGHNLSSGDSCFADMPAGGDQDHVNPLIGLLNSNGGFSQTHALLPGSPAIDNGDEYNCPETDQRDWYRPVDGDGIPGAVCDIGAYEYGHLLRFLPLIKKAPPD